MNRLPSEFPEPPPRRGDRLRALAARTGHSLMARLMVAALLMVMAGVVGRFVFLLPFLKENLLQTLAAHQLSQAEYVARDIGGKVDQRLGLLDHLARHLPPELLADPPALRAWLRDRHEIAPLFSNGLVVVRADGHGGVADFPVVDGRLDLDYSASDFFRAAVREHRPVIGAPVRGRVLGQPIIIMAAPVMDWEGQVLAVVAGVTSLSAPGFLDLIQQTPVGRSGGFLLISPRDNMFVSATDSSKILAPLPRPGLNLLHDRAMAGYRGTGVTVNIKGVEELSAMVSVPGTDWFLVARLPTDEAFEPLAAARTFVLRNAVVQGVAAMMLMLVVLHRFLRPLSSAARLIHGMAAGRSELRPVPVVRRDEVGDLVEGFNFLLRRFNDITAEKVAVERLRRIEKERMEESLRQWMADSSHELRTPIAVLRAQIEAIQDGVHEANEGTLRVLHREVMGMSRLVDDLATLALSDVGHLDCQMHPVSPLGLMDDAVAAFGDRFAAAGLDLDWSGCPLDEPVILGDANRLRQVFGNLLENSLRYTVAPGGLRIDALVTAERIELRFDDTAPGVPPEDLPHLFERFYRSDRSRSRERGGSGIGLAVCRTLVEAHGGSIGVQPSPLGGVRFTLVFTRVAEAA